MPSERSFRICLLFSEFRSKVFPPLILIVECHISDVNGHAFFDAARAQFFVQTLEAPDILEAADGFIIVEVCHRNELFDGLAGNNEISCIVA